MTNFIHKQLIIASFLGVCFSLFFPGNVVAQTPSDTTIKCGSHVSEISGDEFHSLRPYQANTQCTDKLSSSFASFCGNDLTLTDAVTVYYGDGKNCKETDDGSGKVECDFEVEVELPVVIDLADADLPIMGNTENVVNSQNEITDASVSKSEDISHKDKINDYVSWYLNGTLNRAEYPFLSADDISGSSIIVDYSGPINKLLPQDIQFIERSKTVRDVKKDEAHDQVVGCSLNVDPSIFGLVGEIFDFGKIQLIDIPFPCYVDMGWAADLLKDGALKTHRLSEWLQKDEYLPPIMSDYDNYSDYREAYKEWRGYACGQVKIPEEVMGINIPIIGGKSILLCINDVFQSKFNSYLFPYIPMSSTEDVEGKIRVDSVSSAENPTVDGITVSNVKFSNQEPATLFFPHILESNQLGSILQDTYAPKDINKKGEPIDVAPDDYCKTLDVRSNEGDDLFADSIKGDLSYKAKFSCSFEEMDEDVETGSQCTENNGDAECVPESWECFEEYGSGSTAGCDSGYKCGFGCTQSCTKNIDINLSTESKTPEIEDVWARLVAGPMSVFRRIFPKINTEGSFGQLIDMPGSTNITYTGTNVAVSQATTDLKLPHVGGISEYFLKGIQTALRPKGYGETITFFGEISPETKDDKDVCTIADKYNIPCCQLKGVMETETGGGLFMGTDSCDTHYGTFSCCHGSVCGPAQIACGQYNAFAGNDRLDMCSDAGAAELLSRAMLLKLCQADGHCTSYDWSKWGIYILAHYQIPDGDYTAAAYFYGLQNGCIVTACSQFRWGAGLGYCDSIKNYCETGQIFTANTDPSFCEACNKEIIRAGQSPMDCSIY